MLYEVITYSECRNGHLPAAPLVLMCNDSAIDPDRAPPGKAVMKLIVLNVPYEIKGDATGKISGRTWDTAKEAVITSYSIHYTKLYEIVACYTDKNWQIRFLYGSA